MTGIRTANLRTRQDLQHVLLGLVSIFLTRAPWVVSMEAPNGAGEITPKAIGTPSNAGFLGACPVAEPGSLITHGGDRVNIRRVRARYLRACAVSIDYSVSANVHISPELSADQSILLNVKMGFAPHRAPDQNLRRSVDGSAKTGVAMCRTPLARVTQRISLGPGA